MNSAIELSISSLPSDVICELFEHAALVDPPHRNVGQIDLVAEQIQLSRGYNLGWILLTHVCHRWRIIGLDMAPLWASIVMVFRSPAVADELLSRARECGLALEIQGCYQKRTPRQQIPFDWAIEHIHRARNLLCDYPQRINLADDAVRVALHGRHLPVLRWITIIASVPRLRSDGPGRLPLELKSPGLLGAHFSDVLPSPSSSLQNLRYLRLRFTMKSSEESMISLLDLLCVLPRLETLTLRLLWYRRAQKSSFPDNVIRMENLKRLEISYADQDADLAGTVIRCISSPNATSVTVNVETTVPRMHISSLLRMALQQYLSRFSFDNLFIGPNGFSMKTEDASDSTLNLSLTFLHSLDPYSYVQVIDELLSLTPRQLAGIRKCELRLANGDFLDRLFPHDTEAMTDVMSAVVRLGRVLTNHITLALPTVLVHLDVVDLLGQYSSSFIPLLDNLRIVECKGQGAVYGMDIDVHSWWEAIRTMLIRRAMVGARVQRLEMVGTGEMTEVWTTAWMRKAEECRELGLVQEVIDARSSDV